MLDALIRENQMDEFADQIQAVAVECVVGETAQDEVQLGNSKAGGLPHAPKGFEWPFFRERPLEFVAQLNCRDFSYENFPESGLLLFFYDNWHWGGNADNKGFIRVKYLEEGTELTTIDAPQIVKKHLWGLLGSSKLPKVYKEVKLSFEKGLSLPDLDRGLITFDDEGWEEAYYEILAGLVNDRFIQIGGYPNPVQTFEIEKGIAELLNRGKAEDWKMILEVNSCFKDINMCWGDAGKIHYFAHIDDLKNKDFTNSWLEMQCF